MVRLAGAMVALALDIDNESRWSMVSAFDSRIVIGRATLSGGIASGVGSTNTVGSAGLIVILAVAVPAALVRRICCDPSAAVNATAREKLTWLAVIWTPLTSSPGSLALTSAPVNPLPVIVTCAVSPRRIEVGLIAVIAGACAVPPVMTWRM